MSNNKAMRVLALRHVANIRNSKLIESPDFLTKYRNADHLDWDGVHDANKALTDVITRASVGLSHMPKLLNARRSQSDSGHESTSRKARQ